MTKPSIVAIPTARPTFVVEVAQQRADDARRLLIELGAEVTGPTQLVMTPDDVAAAAAFLAGRHDLVINVCASFSDASPALALYAQLGKPVLLWSFTEPGPVGDRLWLNSMCGANLFGHALVRAGGSVRLVYGDPGDPGVRDVLTRALAGELPAAPELPDYHGPRASAEDVRRSLTSLSGRRIGIIGDGPPGFTPSEYDGDLLKRLFGLHVQRLELDEAFAAVSAVPDSTRSAELVAATAAQPSLAALNPQDLASFAAVTTTLRDWRGEADLSAMAVRCWPEFPTRLGVSVLVAGTSRGRRHPDRVRAGRLRRGHHVVGRIARQRHHLSGRHGRPGRRVEPGSVVALRVRCHIVGCRPRQRDAVHPLQPEDRCGRQLSAPRRPGRTVSAHRGQRSAVHQWPANADRIRRVLGRTESLPGQHCGHPAGLRCRGVRAGPGHRRFSAPHRTGLDGHPTAAPRCCGRARYPRRGVGRRHSWRARRDAGSRREESVRWQRCQQR